jgi:predicted outer membrane protein
MRQRLSILILGLSLTGPLLAQEARPLPAQGDQSTDNEMPATEGDGLALSMLIAIDDHEIQAAEIARRKNLAQPVADYAKFLFDEHTAHRERSEEIVSAIGAERVDPPELKVLRESKESVRETLAALEGDAFEAAYLDAMLKDHAEATALIETRLLKTAQNDDVVTHLRITHAHLVTHRERARLLAATPQDR